MAKSRKKTTNESQDASLAVSDPIEDSAPTDATAEGERTDDAARPEDDAWTFFGEYPAPEQEGNDTTEPDASLTDPQPVTQSIPVTAQTEAGIVKLRAWADNNGVRFDPYVAGLLAAVDERQDLSAWAAMSPFDLLPHPTPRSGAWVRSFARLVHFIRNVLVFVPVAVTWLGIREATTKFGEYTKTLPDGVEANFLQFWQDGGGLLSEEARIQNIAYADAVLIIIIIVLTVLGGALSAYASRRTARAERITESERIAIALGVKRALHGKREATAESISQSLGESLNDLLNAARMVNIASLRMEAMSVGVESVGPRLESFGARMSELNSRLGADLQRAIDSLTTSVARLGGTVDGELAQTLNQVLVGLDEIREQLGKTSASVEFGTKNLRDDLDAIHGQLAGVVRGGRF